MSSAGESKTKTTFMKLTISLESWYLYQKLFCREFELNEVNLIMDYAKKLSKCFM